MDKSCTKCGLTKDTSLFKIQKNAKSGISSWCKSCHSKQTCISVNRDKANINNKRYKKTSKGVVARKRYKRGRRKVCRLAKPSWIDKSKVDMIYEVAKVLGDVVDHIVPLRSKLVCGLHWEGNLQIITNKENMRKSNVYWENMP